MFLDFLNFPTECLFNMYNAAYQALLRVSSVVVVRTLYNRIAEVRNNSTIL